MMFPDATMSTAERLFECQAWATGLPREPDPPGPPARFGTALHMLAEWFLEPGPWSLEAAADMSGMLARDIPRLERVWSHTLSWLREHSRVTWLREVTFALDPEKNTCRILGHSLGRAYDEAGRQKHEFIGTADIVVPHQGYVTVYDWKTGASSSAKYRSQMACLAYAAARAFDVDRVRSVVLRVDEMAVWPEEEVELGGMALEAIGEEIRRVWLEPDKTPRGGPWCKYCPSYKHCREGRRALVHLRQNPRMTRTCHSERDANGYRQVDSGRG